MSGPASTCGYCCKEGTVSLDQSSHSANGNGDTTSTYLLRRMRFHCVCGNEWVTNGDEAEAQGEFLDRAGLR